MQSNQDAFVGTLQDVYSLQETCIVPSQLILKNSSFTTSTAMIFYTSLVATLLFSIHGIAAEFPFLPSQASGNAKLDTVYQFPNETWVENIVVRPNGNLLVSLITAPEVWEINPRRRTGRLIHHFPHVTSGFGFAEVEPDVFAVSVGNFSVTNFRGMRGTYSMWKIDFRHAPPSITKIADVPEAKVLNGVCVLPGQAGSILMDDSFGGRIYRLDTKSGKHSVWADDPLFKGNASAFAALGINGLRAHGSDVYFTNSFNVPVLGRVPTSKTGAAQLPAQVVIAKPSYPTFQGGQADDFAIDTEGNVWLTSDPSNSLVKITQRLPGKQEVVAGGLNRDVIAGGTSAGFGRTARDAKTLYIVTNGGMANPPKTSIVGGKVVAFDTTDV